MISNHFCEYERQTRFVGELIAPGVEQWHALGEAFKGPKEFMAFVGLDRPPVEPSCDDVNGECLNYTVSFQHWSVQNILYFSCLTN